MISIARYWKLSLVALFFATWTNAQQYTGVMAREIALPDIAGDTVRLSSLKGKVVLLDFWASWCGPCRIANRQLSKIYSRYKDKGFEIYSVSLDENKKAWEKAIQKDRINWIQVNETGGRFAETALAWNIFELPTTFLISKEGELVAMNPEGKQLEDLLNMLL